MEDFLVSNLLLPIGSLVYLLFCVTRWGWGYDKYLTETNTGSGLKMSASPVLKFYFRFLLPILILAILVLGLSTRFWRILVCVLVALFVFLMARRSKN